jgi:serpin B
MWTCPKCGEKIEDQFDSCWKCAARPETTVPAPLAARRWMIFFFWGLAFELLLVLSCFALPENGLSVELRNFTLIAHYPLLILMKNGFGETAPTAILALLVGLAVMAGIWGFLIFQIVRWVRCRAAHLTRPQKLAAGCGAGMLGLILLAWAVVTLRPETPAPFETSAEVKSVVAANNAFALDLYQKLEDQPGNLFFSPYSLSTSLAMACAGARGQTEKEMIQTMHFNLPPEKLHPTFKTLAGRMDKIQRWNRIVLKSARSLWCQKGHDFTGTFLDLVRDNYSAEARTVDFKNPGATADEINRWIDAQTNHKIKGGIGPVELTPDMGLVLCDAIYFKGQWQNAFKTKDTKPAAFHVTTNLTVTVPMMYQSSRLKTTQSDDGTVQLLELPYWGGDLSMIILLPTPPSEMRAEDGHNSVADLEPKLTPENLRVWLAKLEQANPHETSVWLPRFTTTQNFNLVPALKSLGMASAFDDTADFSGMDGTKTLYLSGVFHKAFVTVNESGTEAAAVSIAMAMTASMPYRFNADHPFLFLIRENGSGSILFLGRTINPVQ